VDDDELVAEATALGIDLSAGKDPAELARGSSDRRER
jgi:hypothetical protein